MLHACQREKTDSAVKSFNLVMDYVLTTRHIHSVPMYNIIILFILNIFVTILISYKLPISLKQFELNCFKL